MQKGAVGLQKKTSYLIPDQVLPRLIILPFPSSCCSEVWNDCIRYIQNGSNIEEEIISGYCEMHSN